MQKTENFTPKKPEQVIPNLILKVYKKEELYQASIHQPSKDFQQEEKKETPSTKKKSKKTEQPIQCNQQDISEFQEQNQSNQTRTNGQDFTQRLFILPIEAKKVIISYLLLDYQRIIRVNAKWYVFVYEGLNQWLEELDNKFIKSFLNILDFKNAYFSFTPFKAGNTEAFRLDRNIQAEILPGLEGTTVTLCFKYQTYKQLNTVYKYQFQFDVLPKNKPRNIWILKEDAKHNYDEEKVAQTAGIPEVCTGDYIKIPINFFNFSGLMKFDTILWDKPKSMPIQEQYNLLPLIQKKKVNHRTCYLESQYYDWILFEYFLQENKKVKLDQFNPQLKLKECRCSGVDTVVNKMIYVANDLGWQVANSITHFGLSVEVVKREVIVELKKVGLTVDLQSNIQLRKNDILTFYLTKGD